MESEEQSYADFSREIREIGVSRFPPEGYDRIVFTNGCFDILHAGHLQVLNQAKSVAGGRGAVVVGLNSDDSVKRLKGADRPFMSAYERALLLLHLRMVDHVVTFEEDTPLELITALRPDVIVKGGDYKPNQVIGREHALVILSSFAEGMSTTNIVEKIRGK